MSTYFHPKYMGKYAVGTVIWLRNNYPELGPTECARVLGDGFTAKGVRSWAHRNGVKWIRDGKPRPGQSEVMKRLYAEGKLKPLEKGSPEAMRRGRELSKKLKSGERQHPRGMAGKHHSEETKRHLSEVHRKRNELGLNVNRKPPTQKQRIEAAKRIHDRIRGATKAQMYSSAKRGRRDDLGDTFFRSRWEANYARYLNLLVQQKKIVRWEFEPDIFWFEAIRRGVRSYCPDFKIWGTDGSVYYDEVKGWMDAKSKTKLKRMKKYHPDVMVNVVGEKQYREIEKKLGGAIAGWEFK